MSALKLLQFASYITLAAISEIILLASAFCLPGLQLGAGGVFGAIHNARIAAHVNFGTLLSITRISVVASTCVITRRRTVALRKT
jgi:hypothetical protein